MKKCIVVLEDNDDRRQAMKERLDERLSMYTLILTDDPDEFIKYIHEYKGNILAVSLDHDLYEREDCSTVLTGMLVVDYLVQTEPSFPILLHTSNQPDGRRMQSRLRAAGWSVEWVTPFIDTSWIAKDWYCTLKRAIRSTSKHERVSTIDNAD